MIIGIGSDLCNISRIERAIARHGERFLRRIFTAQEIALADRRPLNMAGSYAKRFAAKEALVKALGTGFSKGIVMSDIAVINDSLGCPHLELYNEAKARAESLLPPEHYLSIHLTMSDDRPFAMAFVVLEARLNEL